MSSLALSKYDKDYQMVSSFILKAFGELIVLKMMQFRPRHNTDMKWELAEMFGVGRQPAFGSQLQTIQENIVLKGYSEVSYDEYGKRVRRIFTITNQGKEYIRLKQMELDAIYWMIHDYGIPDEELRIMEGIRQEQLAYKPENESGYWNEQNEVSD